MTPTISLVKACLYLHIPFLHYLSQALQLRKIRLVLGVLIGEIVIQVTGCARCSLQRNLFTVSGFSNHVGFSL